MAYEIDDIKEALKTARNLCLSSIDNQISRLPATDIRKIAWGDASKSAVNIFERTFLEALREYDNLRGVDEIEDTIKELIGEE